MSERIGYQLTVLYSEIGIYNKVVGIIMKSLSLLMLF